MRFVIAKNSESAADADPNKKLFDSLLNTTKIVAEDTVAFNHPGGGAVTLSTWHDLGFVPLVSALLMVDGESQAYPPNGVGVSAAGPKSLIENGVTFNYVEADDKKIYFRVTSTSGKNLHIHFICWEGI